METEVYVQYSGPSITKEAGLMGEQTWQQWFNHWLTQLDPALSPIDAYSLCLRLTDDAEIQQLNATYRSYNQPTDVLAFAALENLVADTPPPVQWQTDPVELGDIIISLETASRQASEHQHSPEQELAWLASHGLLHLLGWDHPDAASLEQMLQQQDNLLTSMNIL
ncbi:rRNA maturation RNase YbeY [Acaryochloris thomasi]|nr:rRNA maturation RNase YbeY [Acaryochloris thomasi]